MSGRIHSMRYSVTQALGLSVNKTSSFTSSSSSPSITTSTKLKSLRPRKRICLVLYTEQDSTTILLIAHFNGVNPSANDPNCPIVFPQLT